MCVLSRKVKKVCGRHYVLTNGTKKSEKNGVERGEIQRGEKCDAPWRVGRFSVERRKRRQAGYGISAQSGRKSCREFSGLHPFPFGCDKRSSGGQAIAVSCFLLETRMNKHVGGSAISLSRTPILLLVQVSSPLLAAFIISS